MNTPKSIRSTIQSATFVTALVTAIGHVPTASAQFGFADDYQATEPRVARVHAATDCHPQLHTDMVERHANGLKILHESHDIESPDKEVWVRCSVPSSSELSHTEMNKATINGRVGSGYNNQARVVKLCATSAINGGYVCGPSAQPMRGPEDTNAFYFDFSQQRTPGGEWDSGTRYPVVVIKLFPGDRLYGVTYQD